MQRMSNLLLVVILCLLLSPPALSAQVKEARRVLVFRELGPLCSAVALVEEEIHAALDERVSLRMIEFYSESLETTLFATSSKTSCATRTYANMQVVSQF